MTATATANANGTARKSLEPWLFDTVQFYPHQVEGIRILARMKNFLLADQMGLGKSLQALTVFAIDVKLERAESLLIVCPVTLRTNWADEIAKFTAFPFLLLGQIPHPTKAGKFKSLSPAERSKQLKEFRALPGPKVVIVNYEQVTAHSAELNDFDMVCLDEAHLIKNPDAKRTRACLALRRKRTAIMTGTPVLNRVDELWPLLHMIDRYRWPSYRRFINRYCVFGGYKNQQVTGAKNTRELNDALAKVMLRRLKRDVLTLPEPSIITVSVDLHPSQRSMYDEIEETLSLPDPNGNLQEIDNALVKFLRLKQICGSTGTQPGFPDHSYKLDRAVEIITEILMNDEKVVVFTQFRTIQALLVERLRAAGVMYIGELHGDVPMAERQQVVKDWANFPMAAPLVCMLQVAGVGLNMVAARTAVFVDKLFVPGLNNQAIDRLHRIGQQETQPVEVYMLIANGTIEQRIEQILKGKDKVVKEVVEDSVAFRALLDALQKAGGNP